MPETESPGKLWPYLEVALLVILFFAYAGDLAPMVNEAHYLVKAKNFWQPDWCSGDLFTSSGKAHTTFYFLLGWPTQFVSLGTTAWLGRLVGWTLLAIGLQRLSWRLLPYRFASLGVAAIWIAGIEYGDLAGEWVVGGIEAKVPAYGFVLMGLAEMVDRRWNRVWPLLGVASAFHVLSGGWSVVAAMLVWLVTERGRPDRIPLLCPALFIGGAISFFGLIPAIWLTVGASAQDSASAARIYTFFRLKHHLLPSGLLPIWYLRHGVLISATILAVVVSRRWSNPRAWQRLGWFTCGVVLIALIGLAIGLIAPYSPDLAAKLLRYYWFRMTDAIVPLTLGLLMMRWITATEAVQSHRAVGVAVLVIAIGLISHSGYSRARLGVPPSASNDLLGWDVGASVKVQRAVFADWLAVCTWVREATPADEVFLTPRHQQTFKWYAERAEVVNWKDVPQDAAALKQWYRRFKDVFPVWRRNVRLGSIRVTINYADLRRYRKQYNVRFMIVDRRIAGPNLPLAKVYPVGEETNRTYAVYELPY